MVTRDSERFFVSLWLEQLHQLTVDTYRFRAMNSHSILSELLLAIMSTQLGVWSEVNIPLISQEAEDILITDKIIGNMTSFQLGVLGVIKDLKKKSKYKESELILSNALKYLSRHYLAKLKIGIHNAMTVDNLNDVEWHTKTLITELIFLKFDRQYLYVTGSSIFFYSKSDKTFHEKLEHMFRTITPRSVNYRVSLKVSAHESEFLPDNLLDFSCSKTLDSEIACHPQAEKFAIISSDNDRFLSTSVPAVDSYSAAIIAAAKLGYYIDTFHYGFQDHGKIAVEDRCIVSDPSKQLISFRKTRYDLLGFVKSGPEWFTRFYDQLSKIDVSKHISPLSKDKIIGSLRYFRLSKESTAIENKFLNLWIALEHLIHTEAKGISAIKAITSIAPEILSLHYISSLIRDAIDNIVRCRIEIPTHLRDYLIIDHRERFIGFSRESSKYQDLINSATSNPLLVHRLQRIQLILSTSTSISQAIQKKPQ